jgi:cell division protease FtsH
MDRIAADRALTDNQRMGPLERAVYKSDWLSSRAYHDHLAAAAVRRRSGTGAPERSVDSKAAKGIDSVPPGPRGIADLRNSVSKRVDVGVEGDDENLADGLYEESAAEEELVAPMPGRIAARLLLARLFDRNPSVLPRLLLGSPVVLVDVPDTGFHARVAWDWKDVLGLSALRLIGMAQLRENTRREDYGVIEAVFNDPMAPKDRATADARAFIAVQMALPIVAITPSAETHLSKVLLEAATDRLDLPPIDADLVRSVIRIVTGKRCADSVPADVAARIGLHELLLAVRFDRSPADCIGRLVRAVEAKHAKAGSRDLSLDELFGLDEAVEWARSVRADLQAWKRGEISWDAIDAGIVLNGPPGVGKTLLAKTVAEYLGIPMVAGTLAKWQGSGEGHLGHLLRAMKADFDQARAAAAGGVIFFCDELDSFPNRSEITHAHRDYVVEVVNGFIEQVDGLQGRHGIIYIGCTNDVRRCDPAIVRAGRFNRIIEVRLPEPPVIEKMMRVRLRGDLKDESIEHIALLAIGSSGADVERIVKDARRRARHEGRPMKVAELRAAVVGVSPELSPEMLERITVHEAGHIVMAVIHNGPEEIQAIVGGANDTAAFVASRTRAGAGTLADHRKDLQRMLAGRAAEELVFGAAGDGSGGRARTSDLARATRLASALVGSFGHAGPHPLVFLSDDFQAEAVLDQAYLRIAVQVELKTAHDEAKRILTQNGEALRKVADQLRTEGRIDGHEVKRIVESFRGATDVFGIRSKSYAE